MSKTVSDFWQYMDADGGYITVFAVDGHLEIVPHTFATVEAAQEAARRYFAKRRYKLEVQGCEEIESDHC